MLHALERRIAVIYRSLSAKSLAEELEASLKRLRVDTIDLYQIHWPNPEQEIEEGWEALARLKEQGKVRYIGVSNFNVEQMKRAQKIAPITSLQPPYSLLNRSNRGGDPALLPGTRYWRDQLFADVVWAADRQDDG